MDMWRKLPLRSEDPYRINRKTENPSFSSTLLDAIYRSIDESNGTNRKEEELIHYRKTVQNNSFKEREEMGGTTLRRAGLVEKCMEKKVVSCEKGIVRRKSMAADFPQKGFNSVMLNSSSRNSSESSCGSIGGFSLSESVSVSDSFYGTTTARSRSSATITTNYSAQRPKPIRTSISGARPVRFDIPHVNVIDTNVRPPTQKPNTNYNKHEEGGFVKTKSKALKLYSDLKKVKQPLSPGGRLASFLNSIFNTSGNAKKKAKVSSSSSSSGGMYEEERATCSSVSSFSRSCLSKTPSSGGKSTTNGAKRSVKFFPGSVIVDEDCRSCGHKSQDQPQHIARNINEELDEFRVMKENPGVVKAAKELLKSYQNKKKEEEFEKELLKSYQNKKNEEEFDIVSYNKNEVSYTDDDDDDLFELDNLSAIGIERYRQELPVYETTHFRTNRAIVNGLIL